MSEETPTKEHPDHKSQVMERVKLALSATVLGLAAVLVAKAEDTSLMNAAILNLAVSIISMLTYFRLSDGHRTTKARLGLGRATVLWLAACIPMFIEAAAEDDDVEKSTSVPDRLKQVPDPAKIPPNATDHFNQNSGRNYKTKVVEGAVGGAVELDSITWACAILAAVNLFAYAMQWWDDMASTRYEKVRDQEAVSMDEVPGGSGRA